MRILNDFRLLGLAAAAAVATISILANLPNGLGACFWQFINLIWIYNFYHLARQVDNMFDE